MAKPLADRLKYYPTRKRWRLRYRLPDGRYLSKLFGPACNEGDQAAYASAVLEAQVWIVEQEKQFDVRAHAEALSNAKKAETEAMRRMVQASGEYRRGERTRDEAMALINEGMADDFKAVGEQRRLQQPQLRLLKRIEELEPLAEQSIRLDAENARLSAEVEHLKAIVTATGRAAATSDGPLAKRFKDPADQLKLVIVRDMWLTGFDCPCMHTLYVDKPMRGHGLMQAIARVNRVFRDKPGGLVVDYIGIADQLKKALVTYTESGGQGSTTVDQGEAVAIMQEKYEVVVAMYHGFDYSRFFSEQASQRMAVIPEAIEHILGLEDGKSRYLQAVLELAKAYSLAVPHKDALAIRDEVGFFQAVRAGIVKATVAGGKSPEDLDTAVRQIVSKAVASEGVLDIFASAGLKNPDISILSDEFLADVQGLPQKNLALEMLRKLLNDEIKVRGRKNIVQARSFREMLESSIKKYQNRGIETAEVIEELIELAKKMQEAQRRGEKLGLNQSEEAFYDALANNTSAVNDLGDETLKAIARELANRIRTSATIDWTIKETVRAEMRAMIRRLLRKYKYPPDQQEAATELVLQQAETLALDFAGS